MVSLLSGPNAYSMKKAPSPKAGLLLVVATNGGFISFRHKKTDFPPKVEYDLASQATNHAQLNRSWVS